jgi:hypothetical protein
LRGKLRFPKNARYVAPEVNRVKIFAVYLHSLAIALLSTSALAHAPVAPDQAADAAANTSLSNNYTVSFTLSAGDKQQQGEIVTARSSISFDLIDDPEHTLRFKGQLKETDGQHVTLAYQAMLVTVVAPPGSNRQTATTSGEGAVRLEFDKPVTILSSPRQRLDVSVRRSAPTPARGG